MPGPRTFLAELARRALPETQAGPAESTEDATTARPDPDRPSLLSRMKELHANGHDEDLYA